MDHLAGLAAINNRRHEQTPQEQIDIHARCWMSSGLFQADTSFYRAVLPDSFTDCHSESSIEKAAEHFGQALKLAPFHTSLRCYIESVVRCCEDPDQVVTITPEIIEQLSDAAMNVFMHDGNPNKPDVICEWGDMLVTLMTIQEERWAEGACIHKLPCAARFAYAAALKTQPYHVDCLLGMHV